MLNIKKSLFILGLLPFQLIFGQTDSVYRFTLNEAMKYALENNYNVRNAGLDIEIAKKEVWQTTAIGLPQISGKLEYQHIPGEIPSFSFPSENGQEAEVPIGVKNSSTYSVTVSQLVFSGEYIVGLQASRTYLQLSQNSKTLTDFATKANVANGYYSVLVLRKNKEIIDSSIVNMNQILEETKAMVDQGFTDANEYDQLSITYNTLKNSSKSMDRMIETSERLFKISLGLSVDDQIEMTEGLDQILLQSNFQALMEGTYQVSELINYKVAKTQEDVSALSLKREKSKFLPTVSAFYMYQDKTNAPALDFTINNIIGATLSVPIFSSGQRISQVGEAKLGLQQARNNTIQTAENLIMSIEQARSNFLNAYEKYQVEMENIKLTKRIYEHTLIKFKEGMASSLELSQVNNQYLNSNSAYHNAILEMLQAKTELKRALNNL